MRKLGYFIGIILISTFFMGCNNLNLETTDETSSTTTEYITTLEQTTTIQSTTTEEEIETPSSFYIPEETFDSIDFIKNYSAETWGQKVLVDSEKNIVFISSTKFMKFNDHGEVIVENSVVNIMETYEGYDPISDFIVGSLIEDSKGNYIITFRNLQLINTGFIVKLDHDGNLIHLEVIEDFWVYYSDILDDVLYIVGRVPKPNVGINDNGDESLTYDYDVVVRAYDSNMDLIWERYLTEEFSYFPFDITIVNDQINVLVRPYDMQQVVSLYVLDFDGQILSVTPLQSVGSFFVEYNVDLKTFYIDDESMIILHDHFLIHIDLTEGVATYHYIPDVPSEIEVSRTIFTDFVVMEDGNYIISGYMRRLNQKDAFVMELDVEFNLLNYRIFNGDSDDDISALAVYDQNRIVMSGSYYSAFGDVIYNPGQESAMLLININRDFNSVLLNLSQPIEVVVEGGEFISFEVGDDYEEQGVTVSYDGEVNIDVVGEVNPLVPGKYIIQYFIHADNGKTLYRERIVYVLEEGDLLDEVNVINLVNLEAITPGLGKALMGFDQNHNLYLSEDEVLNVQNLSLNYLMITDTSFLNYFENVITLSLYGNAISDISFIEYMDYLEQVNLGSNHISDLSVFEGKSTIQYLALSFNLIEDVSGLNNMSSLEMLDMYMNQIASISNMGSLPALKELCFGHNMVTTIDTLNLYPNLV